jgi:HEPN domain-containing protein
MIQGQKMQRLGRLAKKIVSKYHPDAIVLLETKAEENGGRNHLDMVILKDTPKPPPQRRAEVEALFEDVETPVDTVVYTLDELHYLYSTASPFVHRMMREGTLLYVKKAVALGVEHAKDELESAMVLYQHDRYEGACYHSRQAIEKGLNAMIISKAKNPEATGDTVELYNRAAALGFKTGLAVEDAVYVNGFGVHKHPVEEALLPHFKPSREDAERAVDAARRLVEKLDVLKGSKGRAGRGLPFAPSAP